MSCLLIWFVFLPNICGGAEYNNKSFPGLFKFGVATSAYQIEGAWNADGKGVNIWDHLLHANPNFTENGDIAIDFYNKYRDDIALIEDIGVDFLRFSISWSRILPSGTKEYVNTKGIRFYKSLISQLLKHGIEPMVTIYHFDLPQALEDRGGFLNDSFDEWFADYATILYQAFGDLVKTWTTFNEPIVICSYGYGIGTAAPAVKGDGVLDYKCGRNLLKAHAKAYHIYNKKFRAKQKGEVGIVLMSDWFVPGSNSTEDVEAAESRVQFMMGWFANPIFVGDYPEVMKSRIAERSRLEGRNGSRLPEFSPEEIDYIRGTYDYFGLNYYNSYLTYATPETPVAKGPSYDYDVGARLEVSPDWKPTCSDRLHVAPAGIRSFLVFIKERYGDVPVYITENGFCDFGGLNDTQRVDNIKSHLSELLVALHEDKVDVRKYAYWSIFDNFEWPSGYVSKFGLYQVDFDKKDLPRTPKASAHAYKKIIHTRCLVDQCDFVNGSYKRS